MEKLERQHRGGRARAVCAKMLAGDDISEEKLAADVDMWWHLVAAELECGIIDETGEYVGGDIDWERKMAGYRDWMRRHPESRAVWETRPVRSTFTARMRCTAAGPGCSGGHRGSQRPAWRWSRPARAEVRQEKLRAREGVADALPMTTQ